MPSCRRRRRFLHLTCCESVPSFAPTVALPTLWPSITLPQSFFLGPTTASCFPPFAAALVHTPFTAAHTTIRHLTPNITTHSRSYAICIYPFGPLTLLFHARLSVLRLTTSFRPSGAEKRRELCSTYTPTATCITRRGEMSMSAQQAGRARLWST